MLVKKTKNERGTGVVVVVVGGIAKRQLVSKSPPTTPTEHP